MTSCCHTQLRTQVIAVSMLGQTSLNMQQLDVMRTYAAIKTEQWSLAAVQAAAQGVDACRLCAAEHEPQHQQRDRPCA